MMPSRNYYGVVTEEKYPSELADRFIVRFPAGMRDRIAEEARKNGRSMNSEIIARLEASFEHQAQPLGIVELQNILAAERTRVAEEVVRYFENKNQVVIEKAPRKKGGGA